MLFRKTSTATREGYVYRFNDGTTNIIAGGGDAAVWVKTLHAMDDHEVYNNIKNSRPSAAGSAKEWNLSIDALTKVDPDCSFIAAEMAASIADAQDPQREILYEVLSGLPEESQKLYRRYFVEGYTQEEIAETAGVSQKMISKRLARLKKELQEGCKKYF